MNTSPPPGLRLGATTPTTLTVTAVLVKLDARLSCRDLRGVAGGLADRCEASERGGAAPTHRASFVRATAYPPPPAGAPPPPAPALLGS